MPKHKIVWMFWCDGYLRATSTSIGNRRTNRPTDQHRWTKKDQPPTAMGPIYKFSQHEINEERAVGRIHIGFVPISPICCDGGCDCRGVVVIEALSSCFADTMNMSRFLNGGCMLPMFFSTASRRLSPTNMYFMWYRKSAIVSTNTRDVVWRHT